VGGGIEDAFALGETARQLLPYIHASLEVEVVTPVSNVNFSLAVLSLDGAGIMASHSDDHGEPLSSLEPGIYRIRARLDNPLRVGRYHLAIGADTAIGQAPIFRVPNAVTFDVLEISLDPEPYPQYTGFIVNGSALWSLPLLSSGPRLKTNDDVSPFSARVGA
jgi:hypothetical protein